MQDGLTDFKQYYFSQPLVTRTFIAAVVVQTIFISLGILSPYSLTYTFRQAFMHFEIWRPFTAGIFMGKFSFGFIFEIMFAYQFLKKTQVELFSKQTYADFLWLIIWSFLSLILISSIFPIYVYSKAFVMIVTYVYCKKRPFEQIRLMFGFKVKTGIFPFVYMGIMVLFGSSFYPLIIGIGLGHLYIFLKDIFAVQHHKDYLATPEFLKRWWYKRENIRVQNIPGRQQANQGGAFGGSGVRIG